MQLAHNIRDIETVDAQNRGVSGQMKEINT